MNSCASFCLAALTAVVTACSAAHAGVPKLSCRHFLATVGYAGDMPYSVVESLRPWMALRLRTASANPVAGSPSADFRWAAESGDRWIVVYADRASGHERFALFTPIARNAATYRRVTPGRGRAAWFADPNCRGIDSALDAYPGWL